MMSRSYFVSMFLGISMGAICIHASAQNEQVNTQRPIVQAEPVALKWQDMTLDSSSYQSEYLSNGAVIVGKKTDNKRFHLKIVFGTGVYERPQSQRPALGLVVALLNRAGAGSLHQEEYESKRKDLGLETEWSLSRNGYVTFSATALSSVATEAMALLEKHLLEPALEEKHFNVAKQKAIEEFENFLDGSSRHAQALFLEQELRKLSLGSDHFYTTVLSRISKKTLAPLSFNDIKALSLGLIQSQGTLFSYAGGVPAGFLDFLKKLSSSLKAGQTPVKLWLPGAFPARPHQSKPQIVLIKKPDMTQYAVSAHVTLLSQGKFNEIDWTYATILEDIFSSDRGVVGNDRFSKALRADSGLSYSPHAAFLNYLRPNTNGYLWQLHFELPAGQVERGLRLALSTWGDFVNKGVTAAELNRSRVGLINSILASERTAFSEIDEVCDRWENREMVTADPRLLKLHRLDRARNLNGANALLKNVPGHSQISIALIGPATAADVSALKKSKDLNLTAVKDFTQLVKELQ